MNETTAAVYEAAENDELFVPESADHGVGKETRGARFFAYLLAAVAVTVGAAFASRALLPASAVCDPFAGCASATDAAIRAGRLLLPTLAAFAAVYLFAHSPFALPAAFAALAFEGAHAGTAFFAAVGGKTDFRSVIFAAAVALSAMCLAIFAARACALSPAARSVRFSSFDGRREAAGIMLSFFTLSGASAVFIAASALILHFGG